MSTSVSATSVFAAHRNTMFKAWRVRLQFTGKLIGGCPKDAKLVEGWLNKNMGLEDEDLRRRMIIHLNEMGVEIPLDATVEEIQEATDRLAGEIKTQGFKRDAEDRPYIESRQINAGIKEAVAVLFPGGKTVNTFRWGITGKSPKDYTAERSFVQPEVLPVADEVGGTDLFLGHIKIKGVPQATIGYAEFVERPLVTFALLTARGSDDLDEAWPDIWSYMEVNGLGAKRSQDFGRFAVIEFEPMPTTNIDEILG